MDTKLIEMSDEDVVELKTRMSLLETQRRIAQALERDFSAFFHERYEVDIAEGMWELDIQRGLLRRVGSNMSDLEAANGSSNGTTTQ